MDREKAKLKIKELIDYFRLNYQKHRSELEANTETKLIEPLFEILGWTKDDFVKREKAYRGVNRGFADYAFYIGDKIVFFLEVKQVGIQLDKEANKQAVSYALSRRIPFAVSTNFEQLNIFCVESKNQPFFKRFINCDEYFSHFEDLLFLSKEYFEQGLTLKRAGEEGRLKQRISIDKPLLEDFMRIRRLIADDIEKSYPSKYNPNEKDEIIQRIIDRLIFIRRSEDIGINPNNLVLEEIKHLPGDKAYPKLKYFFSKYDDKYNSGLFTHNQDNDCDKINIDGEIIKKLVYYLYESHDKNYVYNFEWIDADVLGQVYEQYLGKILAQNKSGKSKLKEGQAHRKEQGIYYTPTYVVDYIVKNTLGEVLKDKKIDVKNLKILDPACGSGSFLIKAFDYLQKQLSTDKNSVQYKLDSQGQYSVKTEILKNNLFGVDLDNKAVEITKLNLLLKAAEKDRKLPEELDLHIRHGNSLIDDENVAGLDAFKWTGDFQEGTFDVVIGNPPYGYRGIPTPELKKAYGEKYVTSEGNFDMYRFFIERSISLLREGGLLGFIIPNTFLTATSYKKLRKYILDNCTINQIVDIGLNVFEGVTVESIILILNKTFADNHKNKQKIQISICRSKTESLMESTNIYFIPQSEFVTSKYNNFNIYLDSKANQITHKIENNSILLERIAYVTVGINTGYIKEVLVSDKKIDNRYHKLLSGRDISRYSLRWSGQWILYDKSVVASYGNKGRTLPDESIFKEDKILVQRTRRGMARKLICTFDNEQYYNLNRLGNIVIRNENFSLSYCLGLLNSKLMDYYFQKKFNEYEVKPIHLRQLPINQIALIQQRPIIHLVDRILSLNKQLQEFGDKKTTQTAKLEEEIKKTDEEIDELVYKLYGITEVEKKIIEENLK
jgi:type I restriction-modification system DNA methylase subunit